MVHIDYLLIRETLYKNNSFSYVYFTIKDIQYNLVLFIWSSFQLLKREGKLFIKLSLSTFHTQILRCYQFARKHCVQFSCNYIIFKRFRILHCLFRFQKITWGQAVRLDIHYEFVSYQLNILSILRKSTIYTKNKQYKYVFGSIFRLERNNQCLTFMINIYLLASKYILIPCLRCIPKRCLF